MSVIYDPRKSPPKPKPLTAEIERQPVLTALRFLSVAAWSLFAIIVAAGLIISGFYATEQYRAHQSGHIIRK